MITLTEQAQRKIKQQLSRRGKGMGIRIGVRTTGCSGMAYVLEYVDEMADGDENFGTDDVAVIVDAKTQAYINGMTVDYIRKGLNEGFEFINPNERDRCGCGESFRV